MSEPFPIPPKDRRFTKPIKELVGIFGDSGTGKTHMALTVAKWHQLLGSPARFYAVSTDQGYGPLLEGPDFYDLENIEVAEVYDIDEAIRAAKDFHERVKRGDWILSDRSDHIWSWASDEYAAAIARKEGSDIENLGDLWKVEGGTGDYPIKGWEWGFPNARYRAYRNLLLSSKAHIISITDEKLLTQESASGKTKENQEAKNTFKHLGLKPTGQKDDISLLHSIFHVQSPEPKVQMVATGKEKWGNREWIGKKTKGGPVLHVRVDDFWEEYFVKIAGWTVG